MIVPERFTQSSKECPFDVVATQLTTNNSASSSSTSTSSALQAVSSHVDTCIPVVYNDIIVDASDAVS